MSLIDNMNNETVEHLTVREPILVAPDLRLRDAVKLMRDKALGCVMVTGEDGKVLGVFTESMLVEVLAHHPQALEDPIEKQMAPRFPWVRNNDPIAFVVDAMQVKNVRLMSVLDEQDQPIGLTGQRGVMEYVADHFPGDVTVQRVGMPAYSARREGA